MLAGTCGIAPFVPVSESAQLNDAVFSKLSKLTPGVACIASDLRKICERSAHLYVRSPLVIAHVLSRTQQCNLVWGTGCELLMGSSRCATWCEALAVNS